MDRSLALVWLALVAVTGLGWLGVGPDASVEPRALIDERERRASRAVEDVRLDSPAQVPETKRNARHIEPAEAVPTDRSRTSAAKASARPSLTVLVVDASGRPVTGVPVGLEGVANALFFPLSVKTTDASGEVHYRRNEYEKHRYARLAIPFRKAVRKRLPTKGRRLTLVAPPVGRLRLDIVDPSGACHRRGAETLSFQLPNRLPPVWNIELSSLERSIVFPLDTEYRFSLAAKEHWRAIPGGHWPALTAGAPERVHRIVRTSRYPRLAGRFVDLEGRAFLGSGVFTEFANGRSSTRVVQTQRDGSFAVAVRLDGSDRSGEFLLNAPDGSAEYRHEVDLPGMLPDDDLPLGDLVLRERPYLVAGHILAPRGHSLSIALEVFEQAAGSDDWKRLPLHAKTDSQGRFRIVHEAKPGASYRVHEAEASLAQSTPGTFEPGRCDLRIELVEPAELIARVFGGDDVVTRLRLDLVDPAPCPKRRPAERPGLVFRGYFSHGPAVPVRERSSGRKLAPGIVDGVLSTRDGVVLARYPGIQLTSGETTTIDLDAGRFRLLSVAVLAKGLDSDEVRVFVRDASYPQREVEPAGRARRLGASRTSPWQRTTYEIVTGHPTVDVLVLAKGRAPMPLDGLSEDVDCPLPSGPRVTLALPAGLNPSAGSWRLFAVFTPLENPYASLTPTRWSAAVPAKGGLHATLSVPGLYRLRWVASHPKRRPVVLATHPEVLAIEPGATTLHLPVPRAAWEAVR